MNKVRDLRCMHIVEDVESDDSSEDERNPCTNVLECVSDVTT